MVCHAFALFVDSDSCPAAFLDVLHPHSKPNLGGGCTRFNAALDPNNAALADHPTILGCPFQKRHKSVVPLTPSDTPPLSPLAETFDLSKSLHFLPSQVEDAVSPAPKSAVDTSFNARMRSYMTEGQQNFLTWLREHSIRPFVESLQSNSSSFAGYLSPTQKRAIIEGYDSCLMALKGWRDAHILIVTQYVIIPARKPTSILSQIPPRHPGDVGKPKVVRGTGGTSLVPLLKIYRDNTLRALLTPLQWFR